MKALARAIFHLALNIFFTNKSFSLKSYNLKNRRQLVWVNEHVGRLIALGMFERSESAFLSKYISKGSICIDIGANVGYFTNMFSDLVGENGKVIAIEPVPQNAQLISINLAMNDYANRAILVNCAVGDKNEGVVKFDTTKETQYGFVLNEVVRPEIQYGNIGSKLIEVPIRTIDSILEEAKVEKVDVLKMDIEGFEMKALRGMEGFLSKKESRPQLLFIELYDEHLIYYGNSVAEVISYLESFTYKPFYLSGGKLLPFTKNLYNKYSNVFFQLS